MSKPTSVPAEILEIDEAHLGPAMLALNPMQRRFVVGVLMDAKGSPRAAAEWAGYSGDDNTLRATGHKLMRHPGVQAAIHEEGTKRLGGAVLQATATLLEIMSNAQNEPGVRLKAVAMVLNRAGLHEKTEHKLTVDKSGDEAGKIREIRLLAQSLGIDAQKLLGSAGIVDAEFEVVEALPKQEWEE